MNVTVVENGDCEVGLARHVRESVTPRPPSQRDANAEHVCFL